MKKKLVCILVCTLMIITTATSVVGNMNVKRITTETSNNSELINDNNFNEQNVKPNFVTTGWYERDKLTASDGLNGDKFGCSVSIDGDYCIVGAYSDDDKNGSVYVYKLDGSNWIEHQKLTASDAANDDEFGISVSMDGEYAIFGAAGDDEHGWRTGAAYIFKRDGTTWTEQQKLTASDAAEGDWFGFTVSIDGEYAVIGADGNDDDGDSSGSAYIFKRDGTTWTEQQKLTASDAAEDDWFGYSVSIDGDYAIIGAQYNDDDGVESGSAYIFKRDGTTWTEQQKLTASDAEEYDWFGYSVSIDGGYAIIGAFKNDDDGDSSGSAYIFKRDGTTWTEQQKITASDADAGDRFGFSVSIDENRALISSPFDDDIEVMSGSAYIYKRDGMSWSEEDKITASDPNYEAQFGEHVSINGDNVIVGAMYKDYSKGAAYVFSRPIPKIHCCGCLCWCNVEPGETVIGEFTVYNIGEPGSELNWEIESYPSWGIWTVNPLSGTGLTPEMDPIKVDVEVVAPEDGGEYTGEVKVKNSEDDNDFCIVTVSLTLKEDTTKPTVKIEKPIRGRYFLNRFIRPFHLPRITQIFGDITVKVNATDDESGINRVEFFGGLRGTTPLGNDTTEPYNITWHRDRIRLIHIQTLRVVAYDNAGNKACDSIIVRKIL